MKTTPTPLYVEQLRAIAERTLKILDECKAAPKDRARYLSYVRSAIALADITCPMRLDYLLQFEDGDFAHDVFGILRHLDSNTGKLGGCFDPRCSAPAHAEIN